MSTVALTIRQVRYVNKTFWRNPSRALLSFAFPLVFLVVFTSLLSNGEVRLGSLTIKKSTRFVAAMAAFGVVQACFSNVVMSVTTQRQSGILKRTNGTPLLGAAYLGARVLHSSMLAVLLVAITAVFGRLAYSAHPPTGTTLVESLVMLVVGAASLCALAFAFTAAIPNADAAVPMVNIAVLPLLFLSGIFNTLDNGTPSWLAWVAKVFPVRHFLAGMQAGFIGTPFHWTDVAVVAAWGIGGLLLAVRYFRWEPSAG